MTSTAVEILNITFEQGTSFDMVYTWTDANGNPIDLTGYQAKLIVATDLINKTQILLFSSGDDGTPNTSITLGGAAGTVEVQAEASATTAMTFSTGVYALIVQDGSGTTTKLLEGAIGLNLGLSW